MVGETNIEIDCTRPAAGYSSRLMALSNEAVYMFIGLYLHFNVFTEDDFFAPRKRKRPNATAYLDDPGFDLIDDLEAPIKTKREKKSKAEKKSLAKKDKSNKAAKEAPAKEIEAEK